MSCNLSRCRFHSRKQDGTEWLDMQVVARKPQTNPEARAGNNTVTVNSSNTHLPHIAASAVRCDKRQELKT